MNPNDVSALVFDTFGTLVDWRGSLIQELSQFGAARGLAHIDWVAFTDAWRAGYQPAMEPIRKGGSRAAVAAEKVVDQGMVSAPSL